MAGVLALAASCASAQNDGVRARPIPLVENNPRQDRIGPLLYRGGLALTSSDSRFGGLSGLVVSDDGRRMLAVSDTGWWLRAELVYDPSGNLVDMTAVELAPLLGPDGTPQSGKQAGDAEALVRTPDGAFLVSFEGRHRLWRYDSIDAVAGPLPVPAALANAPRNGGLEAVGPLPDGGLLALTESYQTSDDAVRGWVITQDTFAPIDYPFGGYFKPTDLTLLADGRVLVLERGYTPVAGVKARLMLMTTEDLGRAGPVGLTEIARLAPPVSVDNFEGLASRQNDAGETVLYFLSDDNFNPLQRTLLLQFVLTS